jgi:uncharacterized protein (TIGR02246 family)
MLNRKMLLAGTAALSFVLAGCAKTANDGADAPPASAPVADRSADARMLVALDSGWMRNVIAKNVDSLMTYYAPNAVSYGFGAPGKGTDQIRALYTEMVKATVADPTIEPGGIEFSADGTMAYDHGTYSMTMTAPGGKPEKTKGAYLNVWQKIDGEWKLVAEMSSPLPATGSQ